jgi:hypothetical protein
MTDLIATLEAARIAYRAACAARVDAFGPGVYAAEAAVRSTLAAVNAAKAAVDAAAPAKPAPAAPAPVSAPRRLTAADHYRHDRDAHCEGSDDIEYV